MTIEITYGCLITDDGAPLGFAASYHDAAGIEASYLEAQHSAMIGGNPLLLKSELDAIRDGLEQIEDEQCEQDFAQPQEDEPQCDICDNERIIRWANGPAPCPYCSSGVKRDPRPLLAQCAAFIRPLKDMLVEAARIDAALTKEGW